MNKNKAGKILSVVVLCALALSLLTPCVAFSKSGYECGYNFDAAEDLTWDLAGKHKIIEQLYDPLTSVTGSSGNGTGNYIGFDLDMFKNKNNMTFSVNIKLTDDNDGRILHIGASKTTEPYLTLEYLKESNSISLTYFDGTSSEVLYASTADVTGEHITWFNISFVIKKSGSDTTLTLYKDGNVADKKENSAVSLNALSPAMSYMASCAKDEIYISDEARTDAEMLMLATTNVKSFLTYRGVQIKEYSAEDPTDATEDPSAPAGPYIPTNSGISFNWIAYTFDSSLDITMDAHRLVSANVNSYAVTRVNSSSFNGDTGYALARRKGVYPEKYMSFNRDILHSAGSFTIGMWVRRDSSDKVTDGNEDLKLIDFSGPGGYLIFAPFAKNPYIAVGNEYIIPEQPTEEPYQVQMNEFSGKKNEKFTIEDGTGEIPMPTEAVTEKASEIPSQSHTEHATQAPTEGKTEGKTEGNTETSTEALTENPSEGVTEASTEIPTEAPTEASTGYPVIPENAKPASVKHISGTSSSKFNNRWVYVSLTYSSSGRVCAYIDGEMIDSFDSGFTLKELCLTNLNIMTGDYGNDSDRYIIDEIYVSSKALASTEIPKLRSYGIETYVSTVIPTYEEETQDPSDIVKPDDSDLVEDQYNTTATISDFIGTTFDVSSFIGKDINNSASATVRNPSLSQGLNNYGVTLDGTLSYIRYPMEILDDAAETTISVAYKWGGASNGSTQKLFDFSRKKSSVEAPTAYIRLEMGNGTSGLCLRIYDGKKEYTIKTGVNTSGSWVRATVTLGGGTAKLYVNGAEVGRASVNVTLADIKPNYSFVGRSGVKGDALFKGTVDEVYIAPRVLSTEEIQAFEVSGIDNSQHATEPSTEQGDSVSRIWDGMITGVIVVTIALVLLTIGVIITTIFKE